MKFKKILGIDIGGSGIKGAPVNIKKGTLIGERYRIPTPDPATPDAVAEVIVQIIKHFKWEGPVGVGFPGVIQSGVVRTAANIDHAWLDLDAQKLFKKVTGLPVSVLNDADAAGLAEVKYGAGRKIKGAILLTTVGTGIGTSLFTRGKLFPNCELGHIIYNGMDAETWVSDAARKREALSWEEWAQRFNEYLLELERLFWPELIIIGGGVSKKDKKFSDFLSVKAKVVPATLLNEAGIIGAALSAKVNSDQIM
ncbi:MAG: ROK family protein [Bacteroidales bacterium]|nr:ROK family protein [Bacteroidales bacterium]